MAASNEIEVLGHDRLPTVVGGVGPPPAPRREPELPRMPEGGYFEDRVFQVMQDVLREQEQRVAERIRQMDPAR
jgi:hypothetical protein